jgi:hypothetical protein
MIAAAIGLGLCTAAILACALCVVEWIVDGPTKGGDCECGAKSEETEPTPAPPNRTETQTHKHTLAGVLSGCVSVTAIDRRRGRLLNTLT